MRISCTYTRWASANGNVRSRVRWFPRIYGYARLNTSLCIRVYTVVQPGLYGRDLPVFVNITLPKNILLLIPGRRSSVQPRGRYFLIGHSRFYLFVHILGRFCATSFFFFLSFFLSFFLFFLLSNDRFFIALSCLVES